jgi:serine/threonine protein kinase
VAEGATWNLEEGDEVVPGRIALERLGGGELYETYLAWDSRLFAVIVVKVLRPDVLSEDWARRRLEFEAELVDRLDHPVIVRGFGAVLDGPRPHLVLEHLDGPTLRSLIGRQPEGPLDEILPLALHMCSALHYLAIEEVVHLDVKPLNIIMGPQPRLIDLSLARTLEQARRITGPTGTTAYMAPEQCVPGQAGEIGTATDVWGLGVSLYEAVAGHRPFRDPAPAAEVEAGSSGQADRYPQLAEDPSPLPRHLPAPLPELIAACLSRDPTRRPVPAELALGLEPLVARLPRPVQTRKRLLFR